MADEYIRRKDAAKLLGNIFGVDVVRRLHEVPTADVSPVVYCKDCEHYHNAPNGLCYLHTEPKANERGYSGEAVCVEPDDFCSYGVMKEGVSAKCRL